MKKGKEKRRKITLKDGEQALKMHLFGLYSQKKFDPPAGELGKKMKKGKEKGGKLH